MRSCALVVMLLVGLSSGACAEPNEGLGELQARIAAAEVALVFSG